MDLYDKDGNIIEGAMTKDDIEKAKQEAVDAAKEAAIEEYKAANPSETAEEKAAREAKEKEAEGEKTPAELAQEAADRAVAAALRTRDIQDMAKLYAPGDSAKQKEIIDNARRVSGFEETPEGLVSQVEAAAAMSGIDTKGVDLSGLAMTSGGRDVDVKPNVKATEADATVQNALGIKPEDVEKYGDKE
jgi:hypothetical protein